MFTRLSLFKKLLWGDTDLSKQQTLDADLKAKQQINFTANLYREWNTTMFFIVDKARETISDFLQETPKVMGIYLNLI